MDSGKRALWRRFIEIAQPYFFPNVRGGRWATLLLMSGLLVVLFALLTVVVAGIALAVGHVAPTVAEEIAPGMASMIDGALGSGAWLIVLALLAGPALVFAAFRHRLRGHGEAWLLLAIVLLLSLSVTGINVAFL